MSATSDKYQPVDPRPKDNSSPGPVVLSLWLLFLVLAWYGARHLYASVAFDERVPGRTLLLPLAEFNLEVAEATDLPVLESWLGKVSDLLDRTPVVLAAVAAPAPAIEPQRTLAVPQPVAVPGPRQPPAGPVPWWPDNGLPAPRRILLIGDSSIESNLGISLQLRLESFNGVTVQRLGKLSTGITRTDLFDWSQKLSELKQAFQPDLAIAQFGGNDCWPMKVGDRLQPFGTEEWNAAYRERLREFIGQMQRDGSAAVLLGMPMMGSTRFQANLKKLNGMMRQECEALGCTFLSMWDLTSDEKGNPISTVGEEGLEPMWLDDGLHFSRYASRALSEKLAARLQRSFNLVAKDPSLAMAVRFDLYSRHRGRMTSYLAFVPQGATTNLPVVFLLHGVDGDWMDWSEHAHQKLQLQATENKLVVITPDGGRTGWYLDSPLQPDSQIESYFLEELLPDVESRLPVSARQGIAGLSMGGHGALSLALRHPDLFASASSISGVLDLEAAANRRDLLDLLGPPEENPEVWRAHSVRRLLENHPDRAAVQPMFISVGAFDRYRTMNQAVHQLLQQLGVHHLYRESPGDHGWGYWLQALDWHLAWHASVLAGPR